MWLTAGNSPGIAYISQPGFLTSLATDSSDQIVLAPDAVVDNANEFFTEDWVKYGAVDDKLVLQTVDGRQL